MPIIPGRGPNGGPAPFSRKWLEVRCRDYRDKLTAGGAKADMVEQVNDYWPGGASNEFTGRNAWNYCYAQMIRLIGRSEVFESDRERALQALAAAARRQPKPVRCSTGTTHQVHPKSIVALAWLKSLRVDLVQLLEQQALATAAASVEDMKVLTVAPIAEALAYRLWIWIVTHPGPGMPFDPDGSELPDPPAWTGELGHEDLLLLWHAHVDVNQTRNELMTTIAPEGPGAKSMLPLEGWVSAYAHETGKDTFVLLRLHSLGELLANAVSAAIRHRESAPEKKDGNGPGDIPLPNLGNALVS